MAPICSEAAFQSYRLGECRNRQIIIMKNQIISPEIIPSNLLQERHIKQYQTATKSGIETLKKAHQQDPSI